MNGAALALVITLAATTLAAVWPVWQWWKQRQQDKAGGRISDENALRDDQREWYERMSRANEKLLNRVERLEKDRETDRQLIFGLREYIRRIIAANPDMKIPPMPPELGLDPNNR